MPKHAYQQWWLNFEIWSTGPPKRSVTPIIRVKTSKWYKVHCMLIRKLFTTSIDFNEAKCLISNTFENNVAKCSISNIF